MCSAGPEASAQLVVLAKRPVPGRVKTRLTPSFSEEQAAALAAASLCDTLDAVAKAPFASRTLAFDSEPDGWLPAGFDFVRQRGDGLDARLESVFADVFAKRDLPTLLVGMDTPQLDGDLLGRAARMALSADAVLGPACDGGFWIVGFRRECPGVFAGVPMSTSRTYEVQLQRLRANGLCVADLPTLTDVDDAGTAEEVATAAPDTRFARTLRTIVGGRAAA